MTDPQQILDKVIAIRKDYDQHGFCTPYDDHTIALAELLKIAIEGLEKVAEDFGTDHADGNTMIAHDTLTQLSLGIEKLGGGK